jgi:hypothetical protein
MVKKKPLIPPHSHKGDSGVAEPIENHHQRHEVGGPDEIVDFDASHLTYGTVDGDRLPAISETEKGAVPATGTPADKFLGDDGTFQRVVQADVDGVKETDTPQFAGMGIGTAGSANHANLIEGAQIGIATGPRQVFHDADKLLELLDADVNIGDTPTVPGTGGSWTTKTHTGGQYGYGMIELNDDLYIALHTLGQLWQLHGSTWTKVLDFGAQGGRALGVHNGYLFYDKYAAGTGATALIYRSSDGVNWGSVGHCVSQISHSFSYTSYDSKIWIGAAGGVGSTVQYSDDDGVTWYLSLNASSHYGYDYWDSKAKLGVHGADLYAACWVTGHGACIARRRGGSWSYVKDFVSDTETSNPFSWGGKIYVGQGTTLHSSVDGSSWDELAAGVGTIRSITGFQDHLVLCGATKMYWSADGVTFSEMLSTPTCVPVDSCLYGDSLVVGSGDATNATTIIYTDDVYVPAPNGTVFGHLTVHGQFKPGGLVGAEGDILLAGGAEHASWLARGTTGQYVGGVTGGKPVYKAIPASDVVNTPAGDIEAVTVQAAIDELDTEKEPILGNPTADGMSVVSTAAGVRSWLTQCKLTTKTDTGDPASGIEGEICINTFDDNVKIYAEGAWRSLATW